MTSNKDVKIASSNDIADEEEQVLDLSCKKNSAGLDLRVKRPESDQGHNVDPILESLLEETKQAIKATEEIEDECKINGGEIENGYYDSDKNEDSKVSVDIVNMDCCEEDDATLCKKTKRVRKCTSPPLEERRKSVIVNSAPPPLIPLNSVYYSKLQHRKQKYGKSKLLNQHHHRKVRLLGKGYSVRQDDGDNVCDDNSDFESRKDDCKIVETFGNQVAKQCGHYGNYKCGCPDQGSPLLKSILENKLSLSTFLEMNGIEMTAEQMSSGSESKQNDSERKEVQQTQERPVHDPEIFENRGKNLVPNLPHFPEHLPVGHFPFGGVFPPKHFNMHLLHQYRSHENYADVQKFRTLQKNSLRPSDNLSDMLLLRNFNNIHSQGNGLHSQNPRALPNFWLQQHIFNGRFDLDRRADVPVNPMAVPLKRQLASNLHKRKYVWNKPEVVDKAVPKHKPPSLLRMDSMKAYSKGLQNA